MKEVVVDSGCEVRVKIGDMYVDLYRTENANLGITVYEACTNPDKEDGGNVRDIYVGNNSKLDVNYC